MTSTGRYTQRTVGSKPPVKSDIPTDSDPKTEAVRETLRGNPFAKMYGNKEFNE